MADIDVDENQSGGSGRDAIAGYEYQMDVSVWVALYLLVANKQAQEVTLEPASQEDLEAELEATEPGRMTGKFSLKSYRLVVQVKLRNGDAWTIDGIKGLLKYGSDRRPSAADRLVDPSVRYLLVTSAALNGKAADLRVRQPGLWPKAGAMPPSIARVLSADADGRVAVIGGKDPEQLQTEIRLLLTDSFRVPNSQWKNCLNALREDARIRIRGVNEGRWLREDIESLIRKHGGYLANSPELELYVKPTNWGQIRRALDMNHAALIIGPSGTGKTWATRMLYEELHREIPELAHVSIRLGPYELEDDRTASPVLYDIEDPWGRYDFDPKSRPWNDQLDRFFAHATADRMIVATTRRDVAEAARVMEMMNPWLVPLEAEHYGAKERERIYELRIAAIPWDLQDTVLRAKSGVLKELATPLEIQKFFDAVPTIDRLQFSNRKALIEEAVRLAHQNSIERTVIEQIEQRNDVRAAAVIWALLKISDKFSIARLQEIEDRLADKGSEWDRGVTPLVRFFVAARNLRQNDDIVTYYHPRVESGIVQALEKERVIAGKALRALIETWVSLDDLSEWGAGAAAKLIAAIPMGSEIKLWLRPISTDKIDCWLEAHLTNSPGKLAAALDLIAAAGSPENPQAEVARYLLHRAELNDSFFMDHWRRPEKDDDWYSRHRFSPATKPLVERFIRDALPWTHGWYGRDFARDVKRLAADLTGAFLEAAHQIVGLGVTHADDAIAEGALDDLAGFEAIVKAAIDAVQQTPEEKANEQALSLALINGEYSEEYAEHLSTSNEDGYTAGVFLKAYIRRVRKTIGWQHLAAHPHREHLLRYWLAALRDEVKGPHFVEDEDEAPRADAELQPDELAAAFGLAHDSPDEDELWYLLHLAWDERFLQALLGRVKEGDISPKIRLAALTCFLVRAPEKLKEIIDELQARGVTTRLVEIALDLAHLSNVNAFHRIDRKADAKAAIEQLPASFEELGRAFLDLLNDRPLLVSENSRQLLLTIDGETEDIRRLRLAIVDSTSTVWQEDLSALLTTSEDPDIAVEALKAAVREKQNAEIAQSLTHRFAAVRAKVLEAVAGDMPAPLPPALLSMVSDKGQSVRRALASLLASKPDPSHMATLIQLAGDKYSTGTHYVGDDAALPIAREAVEAIKSYPQLDPKTADTLLEIAISSADPHLRSDIFKVLATHAGLSGQEMLFDLATEAGRYRIRSEAAGAFLSALGAVGREIVTKITSELLVAQIESVAAVLALVLGHDGDLETIRHAATGLASNRKRRVLLLLLIRLVIGRDPAIGEELAAMLPNNHPGLEWALGGEIDWQNDQLLSDLGDVRICHEVFVYMRPLKHKD